MTGSVLVLAWLAAHAAGAQTFHMGVRADGHTTLVIKADGSCTLTNESSEARKSLELQISSWERYSRMSESDESDEAASGAPPPKPDAKPLSDDELAAKLRKMYETRSEASGQEDGARIADLQIGSNSVRIVAVRSFASLKDLMSESPYSWGPSVLMPENAQLEIDTNRNLRLTFSPGQAASRFARTLGRQWKSAKIKAEWRLVLPGKILTSGLPMENNATWLSIDSDKADSVESALKLVGAPLVITAEPAGLALEAPLDTRKLARAAWQTKKAQPDIPITDATPGFIAEPIGITLSTIHYFPEGEKQLKARQMESSMMDFEKPGAVISAKLFPPRGRSIKSVSAVRVKSAKDDQGRAIADAKAPGAEDEAVQEFVSFSSSDDEKSGATRIDLRMALPPPDAKSIDVLEGEAVAMTLAGWKEMVLTNAQADAAKEIDLGEILPGATLTIKKISGRKPQQTVEAVLAGPAAVSQVDVKIKVNKQRGGQSHLSDRRSSSFGGKTVRNIHIQAYDFGSMAAETKNAPLTLVVRFPQDLKRERVQFKLTGLDLL